MASILWHLALFCRIKTLSGKIICASNNQRHISQVDALLVSIYNVVNQKRVIWLLSPTTLLLMYTVYHSRIPWYFVSIHFPECRNYCHHSSEVSVTPPCCLLALAALSPLCLCALHTEHAAPPHSLPQPRPPPTLGVLEVNTRYTPDNTAGFSAVRKGKSTWTGRSEEQAGSLTLDYRRRIEGARCWVRRHRDTIFRFPSSRRLW